jgi:hypothetical protein
MKEIFGIVGAILLLGSGVPYIAAMLRGRIKPHAFSWLLWSFINLVVFAAQVTEGAGAGAFATGATTVVNFFIGCYALRHGHRHFTRSDWAVFLSALFAIPLWAVMKHPLYSVILVSVIDVVAFWPTMRKSWHAPYQEAVLPFVMGGFGFFFALLAVENYSFTNYCYLVTVLVANAVFISAICWRRKVVGGAV